MISDWRMHARQILESNSFHVIFCFLSGLCCLLPLFLHSRSNFEKKPLRSALSSSTSGYTYSSVATITLVIPLFFDLFLDLVAVSIDASTSKRRRKLKPKVPETLKFTFLNISERFLILIGLTISPMVAFLPKSTENLAFIYLCCNKCQLNLVGGTLALSLCRYDKKYWSVRSTLLSLISFSIGLVVSPFIDNIYAAEDPVLLYVLLIDTGTFILTIAPAFIFMLNSSRWLLLVYFEATYLNRYLMCSSKLQLDTDVLAASRKKNSETDHTFFPMVYTMCGMILVLLVLAIIGSSARVSEYNSMNLLQLTIPFLVFIILITTLSMRVVKYEVVQGLYALIESKKSYVRYISHELRTPLNSAFLGLKLLTTDLQSSNDPKDADRREILADVNVACRTTLDILNDLLCFDKMESGILVVHKHDVPVLSFISDCVSMFSAQAREGGVTISFSNNGEEDTVGRVISENRSPSPSLSISSLIERDTVFMDRFKMDQVLRNLISNALKFTPRGGSVSVTSYFIAEKTGISLPLGGDDDVVIFNKGSSSSRRSVLLDGLMSGSTPSGLMSLISSNNRNRISPDLESPITKGRLVLVVKDSGSGMVEKDYSRLFKEIVQFNPEVLQAGGGSGLGLWITKGIVDLHQGDISVYSEGLGLGSSFTVQVPMDRIDISQNDISIRSQNIECSRSFTLEMQGLSQSQSQSQSQGHSQFLTVSRISRIGDCPDRSHDEIAQSQSQSQSQSVRVIVSPRSMRTVGVDCRNVHTGRASVKPVYHLLIVDDSPLNRKMLLRTFRAAGHTCDEAEDGVIAITKVKKMMSSDAKVYSAILMDFVMPNMDGPTATRIIRSSGYKAPIFGVTGNTLDSDINYFLDSGANQVLAKPLDMDVFDSTMRRFSSPP